MLEMTRYINLNLSGGTESALLKIQFRKFRWSLNLTKRRVIFYCHSQHKRCEPGECAYNVIESAFHDDSVRIIVYIYVKFHVKWVPVTTAWRFLGLQMEETGGA